jgi:hypothetical protein
MANNIILWANNAQSTLAGAITPTATTVQLAAGTGVLFPQPGANQYFVMTFTDAATGLLTEIVHVTAMSGDQATIVRAQEGTAAQGWNAGDIAANLMTAGTMSAFTQYGQIPILSYAGNPNGNVAGTAGTPGTNGFPTLCFDVTNLIGYFCSTTGTTSTAVWTPISGQAVQFSGGTSTGTANAQVITPVTPGGFTLSAGYTITFTPGITNTGATTLAVGGTAATACRKNSGGSLVAFSGSEFTATEPVTLTYNGTYWVLGGSALGACAALNIGFGLGNDGSGNLRALFSPNVGVSSSSGVIGTAPGSAKTASWKAAQFYMTVGAGGLPYQGRGLTTSQLALNLASSGAGGLDTGSVAANTFYDVYAITKGDGSSFSVLAVLNSTTNGAATYTGSNMPATWIASGFLGTYLTDNSSNLLGFLQQGSLISFPDINALSNTGSQPSTYTSINIASIVPPNARSVFGNGGSANNTNCAFAVAADANGTAKKVFMGAAAVGAQVDNFYNEASPFSDLPISTAQELYYKSTGNSSCLNINGYRV